MDGSRAAHYCGITDNSWRSWKKRHMDGKGGAAKFFPKPITDFAGVDVYLETDVMRFRERLESVSRGRPKSAA